MKAKLPSRICLPDSKGTWLVDTSSIVAVIAQDRYCSLSTTTETKTIFCCLKALQMKLDGFPFYRIHKSYLVNLDHVVHIGSGASWKVTLRDNRQLPVAKARRKGLMEAVACYDTTLKPSVTTTSLRQLQPIGQQTI